jgi:hypothetical protein
MRSQLAPNGGVKVSTLNEKAKKSLVKNEKSRNFLAKKYLLGKMVIKSAIFLSRFNNGIA